MKSVSSSSPCASHQVKNRVTAVPYAARVCGLRIWAVKNSTVRSAACGPARRMVAGRPSICQPPDRTSASGAAATGARASGGGRADALVGGVGCGIRLNRNITSFMLRITMIGKDLQLPSVGAASWRSGRGRRGG